MTPKMPHLLYVHNLPACCVGSGSDYDVATQVDDLRSHVRH